MADKGDSGGGGGEDDDSQKTEEPTAKRLREAREQGQVPMSREVNTWLMLFAGTLVILLNGPSMMEDLTGYLRGMLANSGSIIISEPHDAGEVFNNAARHVFGLLIVPMVAFLAAAFFGPVAQIGIMFSSKSIEPSMNKVNPMEGFKRIFSVKSLLEFVKGILKLIIIGSVSVMVLSPALPTIDLHIGQPFDAALFDIKELSQQLLTAILSALLLLALIDLLYVRFDFHKKMMMTRQQIRDEYKQSEGDPHVKARLRQLRGEKARQRMMQAVPTADVVITNPTHYSVALKYDPDKMDAPIVVAKGVDNVAARIRELAKESAVPIVENPPLARSLHAEVDVDEMIPAELYKAVAEVISYVFRLKAAGIRG